VKRFSIAQLAVLAPALLLCSQGAYAQATPEPSVQVAANQASNVPGAVQQAATTVDEQVRKWHIGADAGIGLDPEIIIVGAHGSFGSLFGVLDFRPGVELGWGELTTTFGINLDVLFPLKGSLGDNAAWRPYFGIGPNFEVSHRGFSTDDSHDGISDADDDHEGTSSDDEHGRFDFGDTNFDAGLNFIVGARKNRLSFEMKATAYGVSTLRLMVGYNF